MARIRLDVVSDVVCPYCWLGKARLDAALAANPDLDVEVAYRPFQLDPNVPREGLGAYEYMHARFGPALNRIRQSQAQLRAAAAAAGIHYRFDEIPRQPNTFDAHRLIRWAHAEGKGAEVVEALFRAHFDELRDVGDPQVLADIGGAAGLDRDVIAQRLASGEDSREVADEEAFFRQLGVSAVPTFIAEGAIAVQGAQDSAVLANFLRQAAMMASDTRMA